MPIERPNRREIAPRSGLISPGKIRCCEGVQFARTRTRRNYMAKEFMRRNARLVGPFPLRASPTGYLHAVLAWRKFSV
jgi:hypothetical protein